MGLASSERKGFRAPFVSQESCMATRRPDSEQLADKGSLSEVEREESDHALGSGSFGIMA